MVSNRQQAIIWINDVPIYWHIYAALGGAELNNNIYQHNLNYIIYMLWMMIYQHSAVLTLQKHLSGVNRPCGKIFIKHIHIALVLECT